VCVGGGVVGLMAKRRKGLKREFARDDEKEKRLKRPLRMTFSLCVCVCVCTLLNGIRDESR